MSTILPHSQALPSMLSQPVASLEAAPLPSHKNVDLLAGMCQGQISSHGRRLYPWGHHSHGNQSAALVLFHGGDTNRVQEEPGQALPAGTGRDMVPHSATPSQHSQDGEGASSPTLSTPNRQGCSRLWWAEI